MTLIDLRRDFVVLHQLSQNKSASVEDRCSANSKEALKSSKIVNALNHMVFTYHSS